MDAPPLFVVGCPRSGTSLIAKLLTAAGLRTVEDDRVHEKYPSGYFEYRPLLMFHKAMERFPRESGNRADYAVTAEPFLQTAYLEDPFVRLMFEQAFAPVLERRVDFLKYPQLALSLPFLLEAFPTAHVVALWREPGPTIQSLAEKEFSWDVAPFRSLRALLLWGVYARHICQAKATAPDRVTVLSVDGLVGGAGDIAPVLRSIGHDVGSAPFTDVADPRRWNSSVKPATRLSLAALRQGLRLRSGGDGDAPPFWDSPTWRARLASLSDTPGAMGDLDASNAAARRR